MTELSHILEESLRPDLPTMRNQPGPVIFLSEQTDARQADQFAAELEEAMRSLQQAMVRTEQTSDDMKRLQEELQSRKWWSALWAGFSGKTHKELATNIEALGRSLEVTQKVVRVILRVQTEKGRLLRIFSDALVARISSIQTDTVTLDNNQRAAALAFLDSLRQQVAERLHQQDLVESHEQRLYDLGYWQCEKNHEDTQRDRAIYLQHEATLRWQSGKERRDAELADRLSELKDTTDGSGKKLDELTSWREKKHSEDEELTKRVNQLALTCSQGLSQSADLFSSVAERQTLLEERIQATTKQLEAQSADIARLNHAQAMFRSLTGVLLRHGLPVIALVVSIVSLFLNR